MSSMYENLWDKKLIYRKNVFRTLLFMQLFGDGA